MNIDKTSMAGESVVVIGTGTIGFFPDTGVEHIISAQPYEHARVVFMSECASRIEGVEIWCHRGPNCIKGINKVSRSHGYYMSTRPDMLPEDPDLAVLNLAILSGAEDIELVAFRDPRDEDEDEMMGNWLIEYAPHISIKCDNDKWKSFEQAPSNDDGVYEFDPVLSDDDEWITDMQEQTAIVCCYKSGGDFDACPREYVHRLYKSCARFISPKLKWRFFVITDRPDLFTDMPLIPITMASNLERWHCKFEIYRTELWRDYSSVICFDLDTIIVGDLSNVLTAKIEFGLLSDIYRPERPATGMIVFRPDEKYRFIYEHILKNIPEKRTWDVYPLLECLGSLGVVPERLQNRFNIYSWKADLHRNGSMAKTPADAQIVVWHGRPRPHHCKWEIPPKEQPPEVEWLTIPKMKVPRTIYIIGGGPSLRQNNPDDYLNRSDCVLAVNDAYQYKCASALLFADQTWWKVHQPQLENWDGKMWTMAAIDHPMLQHIRKERAWLSKDPSWIAWNACTGWAALNMALLAGADRIVLLGYDMQFGRDGAGNWHKNIRRLKSNTFSSFAWRAPNIADCVKRQFPDVQIVVSEPTALTVWPVMTMREAVEWGREPRWNPGNRNRYNEDRT